MLGGFLQIALLLGLLTVCVPLLGGYMARVFTGERVFLTPVIAPRRAGDPARIVATGEAAGRDLDWKMRHDLEDMVRTAWQARSHVA